MREYPANNLESADSSETFQLTSEMLTTDDNQERDLSCTGTRSRRARLQIYLYIATCLTTFAAGTVGWQPVILGLYDGFLIDVSEHWSRGLIYICLLYTSPSPRD